MVASSTETVRLGADSAIRLLLILALFASREVAGETVNHRSDLESAYARIERAYPRAAVVSGSFSAFFGGLALSQGHDILGDARANRDARRAGRLLMGLGTIRLADGLGRILSEPHALRLSKEFREGTLREPEKALVDAAHAGRRARLIRTHMVLATGLIYLYLAEAHAAYRDEAGPGAFLLALAGFQYWRVSPEEAALKGLAKDTRGPRTMWRFSISDQALTVSLQIRL